MAYSILKKITRRHVYQDGKKFLMSKEFLVSEVMLYRDIINEVYVSPVMPEIEFYPEPGAKEIIEELWAEMIKNGNAYLKQDEQ